MVIVMEHEAGEEQVHRVIGLLTEWGYDVHRSTGRTRVVLGAVGSTESKVDPRSIEALPGVQEVVRVSEPFKLVSRLFRQDDTVIRVGEVSIGDKEVVVMAGPYAVEGRDQIREIAARVRESGALILRGSDFTSQTFPYHFKGVGEEGLHYLREAADENEMLVISEVLEPEDISRVAAFADILQVGSRNMQNFALIRELGKTTKPVLLARSPSATVEEWLLSAEYIMLGGNRQVILCERGIRTFERYTRNTLDLSAIPVIEKISHLPVVVDPSHAMGRRARVAPMARAAVAAGADGLVVEVHDQPEKALSDGAQSLAPAELAILMEEIGRVASAIGRSV
jgi:3-deoxy-7-phosphoheptulonate synthase